jgi:hypothetical protein
MIGSLEHAHLKLFLLNGLFSNAEIHTAEIAEQTRRIRCDPFRLKILNLCVSSAITLRSLRCGFLDLLHLIFINQILKRFLVAVADWNHGTTNLDFTFVNDFNCFQCDDERMMNANEFVGWQLGLQRL